MIKRSVQVYNVTGNVVSVEGSDASTFKAFHGYLYKLKTFSLRWNVPVVSCLVSVTEKITVKKTSDNNVQEL